MHKPGSHAIGGKNRGTGPTLTNLMANLSEQALMDLPRGSEFFDQLRSLEACRAESMDAGLECAEGLQLRLFAPHPPFDFVMKRYNRAAATF